VARKKVARQKEQPRADLGITQRKRDRVASILAIMLGLLALREGISVLIGLSVPDDHVLPWLSWYSAAMGAVSVIAGAGMWMKAEWCISLSVNILAFNVIVCGGLIGLDRFVQTVAMTSLFGTMFKAFTWIVIVSLLKWKRQPQS